jgi:hypothetical protein
MEAMSIAIDTLIDEFREQIDGRLTDRGRVIDHLLDLRLVSGENPSMRTEVDELLANVPGLTVVETAWWSETLDRLSDVNEATPVS